MRCLLIEDDTAVREAVVPQLRQAGFLVDEAETPEDALWRWREYDYAIVLLDLGLPGGSGLDVLQTRRQEGDDTPVMILTARNSWHERVEGLRAGADDYLGKPFYFEELLARIEALLRRRHGETGNQRQLMLGAWQLDLDSHTLQVEGQLYKLTAAEFRLLQLLMRAPGKVFSKSALLAQITEDPDARDPNMVEVYIRRLRKRLGREAIETLRGQGYRLKVPEDG